MEPIFEGSAVALVLPMLDDGSIDYDGFKRQVQRMIDGGVQAILVNGTTGETPTIHIDEEFELTKIVMEMTKGTGIINTTFDGYAPYKGEIAYRSQEMNYETNPLDHAPARPFRIPRSGSELHALAGHAHKHRHMLEPQPR